MIAHEASGTVPGRRLFHGKLPERVDMRALEGLSRAERRLRVREQALRLMREEGHILPWESLSKLVNEVSDEVVGLDPWSSCSRTRRRHWRD